MKEFISYSFGFKWGKCEVIRLASNDRPNFQVLRIHTPDKKIIDIIMRPRSTKIQRLKNGGTK